MDDPRKRYNGELPPRPWKAVQLMIVDADGKQVLHNGGIHGEYGMLEPSYIVELNQFIVDRVNGTEAARKEALALRQAYEGE